MTVYLSPSTKDYQVSTVTGISEKETMKLFSEEIAKTVLTEDEIQINVSLGEGSGIATAWGCDLTYDYVKINGDYRT